MSSADATHNPGVVVGDIGAVGAAVGGAVCFGIENNKLSFYLSPSTEGAKKGAEFGRKYFGTIGEKIFATICYVFGPEDKKNNKNE